MPSLALVAGEASGDMHAANLVRALGRLCPDLSCWAVGGPELRAAGAEIAFPSEELSAMGLWEAAGRLPALLRARRAVLERFERTPPDLFVPVDFGGLNLRLALAARRFGIPVVYYIPPKVWAWGGWRAGRLRRAVDEALVILPFEERELRSRGVPARYVGSPVLDHWAPRRFAPEEDAVGLLPGSRPGEVSRIWPLLLEAAGELARGRTLRFLVPRAPGLPPGLLEAPLAGTGLPVEVLDGRAQEVMERARVCLVASGTATLECALAGTPMVVVYRMSRLTYELGRLLVRAPYISLPNLVAGREVVPELVQTGPGPVASKAAALLRDGPVRSAMLEGLAGVRLSLGEAGASARAAEAVREHLDRLGRYREPGPPA
ncbi:MAG: lipid-A-disaccharide synthase [Deferrisomatales bacterium]|nr:lipid-A-disaccharide synthase [Deferrisomatales bacterium]